MYYHWERRLRTITVKEVIEIYFEIMQNIKVILCQYTVSKGS